MTETLARTSADQAEAVACELFRTVEGRTDPYPRYHALRSLRPVHRSDTARGWMLTRYEDCQAVLRDPRFVRGYVQAMDTRRPGWRERPVFVRGESALVNMDGPPHTRLRKLVSKAFTPRVVERLRERIESMVDEMLDPLARAGGGDLMSELAFPLPVRVIGELLGVPVEDRPQFRERMVRFTAIFELGASKEMLDGADAASMETEAYFKQLLAAKRASPGDDLVSALLAVEEAGDGLTEQEVIMLASILFGAGFETTTNLTGNGVVGLLEHPGEIDRLRDDSGLWPNLPEELLRYDGTVQMISRVASEPVELSGFKIGARESVFLMIGAANRDPERYADPDRLDVGRTDIHALTFGSGVHFCVGASLARLEIEIVFRKLLERFGTIELDGDAPVRDRLTLRGRTSVPLRVRVARSSGPSAPAPATTPRAPAPAHHFVAGDGALPARPSGPDDARWRAAFREQIEAGPPPSADEVADRVALLVRLPLFRGCTVAELEELAATAYPIAFDPGEVLCVEGADAGECYVIAEGEATVTSGDRLLARVGADDVVGERGPLLGTPRAATVTAATHLITYAISRDRLLRLVALSPAAGAAMGAELHRRYGESARTARD